MVSYPLFSPPDFARACPGQIALLFLPSEITLAVLFGRVQDCALQRSLGGNLKAVLEAELRDQVLVRQ